MIVERFTGRILLLTAVSLVLAAVALSQPFYTIDTAPTPESMVITHRYFFIGYYVDTDRAGDPFYLYVYDHDPHWETKEVGDIMGLEANLIFGWLAVGVLFLAVVMLDLKRTSLMFGGLVVICLLAVIQFAVRIGDAANSTILLGAIVDHGFCIGFLLVVLATVLQTIAVLMRCYVAYSDLAASHVNIEGTAGP